MLREEFCFHSLFHHYHQQTLQQDTRSFVQHDSAINSEFFINEQFWQRAESVFLQQQQAWRTILYEYNLEIFRIVQCIYNHAEYKQHTENKKTLSYKK